MTAMRKNKKQSQKFRLESMKPLRCCADYQRWKIHYPGCPNRPVKTVHCQVCDKKFPVTQLSQKYCSIKCRFKVEGRDLQVGRR